VNRRELITLLGGTAATWPLAARAQSTTVARVGFLRQAGPDDRHFDAFRGGLRASGYIEGRNSVIERHRVGLAYYMHSLLHLLSELMALRVFRCGA
jgi:putative tryptophan/tyrosine transport system substrate-binding protein